MGRVVCEIKVINDGLNEVAFIPLGEEDIIFTAGELVEVVNESNNVSFEAKVLKNHGGKWLTIKIPPIINLINLRTEPRLEVKDSIKASQMTLATYGEEGVKRLIEKVGEVIDISANGASFEVQARRLDCFYKGEIVELKVSEKLTYLSRVKGRVVHKTLFNMKSGQERAYRIGVKFDKSINLTAIENS